MGDYSNDFGFNNSGGTFTVTKSNEYSTNGEYSARVEVPSNKTGYVRYRIYDVTHLIGEQVTFQCDVKTNNPLTLEVYEYYNSRYNRTSLTIPANSEDSFSITLTVNDSTSTILLDIASNIGNVFFTDNWSFIIQ